MSIQVHLCDRSLMPGDVVRRHVPGQDTQCGFIMDMEVLSHLHILRTNKYIYNVNSRELKPIQVSAVNKECVLPTFMYCLPICKILQGVL